jgi:hypothetical protein
MANALIEYAKGVTARHKRALAERKNEQKKNPDKKVKTVKSATDELFETFPYLISINIMGYKSAEKETALHRIMMNTFLDNCEVGTDRVETHFVYLPALDHNNYDKEYDVCRWAGTFQYMRGEIEDNAQNADMIADIKSFMSEDPGAHQFNASFQELKKKKKKEVNGMAKTIEAPLFEKAMTVAELERKSVARGVERGQVQMGLNMGLSEQEISEKTGMTIQRVRSIKKDLLKSAS